MSNKSDVALELEFDDNRLLPQLFGERDQFIRTIERVLNVTIMGRGNRVVIQGAVKETAIAHTVLSQLYERLKKGLSVGPGEIDASIRIAQASFSKSLENGMAPTFDSLDVAIPTRRRVVTARTERQAQYIQAMQNHDLVFGIGPAGTGKTYLAVATGVALLFAGKVNRIILSRPAVEAGERLGFLPGDLREKVDPYLRPLYDALFDMLPSEQVSKRLASGEIEIAPLAFMRGRTLAKSFVILDEAQNTTTAQMKMFLTRLGEGARMVVTGDLTQVDLPQGVNSGLKESLKVLEDVKGVAMTMFDKNDVVRHPLVAQIIDAYERYDAKQKRGSHPDPHV